MAEELRRRHDCRLGLRDVEVALRGHQGERFVVHVSSWDRHGKLRLKLLPKTLYKEYEADQRSGAKRSELVIMRASEPVEFCDRWANRRLNNVPATEATLLTAWLVKCRCWC